MRVNTIMYFALLFLTFCATATPSLDQLYKDDPFIWLEERQGKEALSWVQRQNNVVERDLVKNPIYKENYKQLSKALAIQDELPKFQIEGKYAYAIYKKTISSRGQWRRINIEKLGVPLDKWTIVIDFDELSKNEKKGYYFYEARCLKPKSNHCLISLSPKGGDSIEIREFDAVKMQFVKDGFRFSEAKQIASWLDQDHVALSREFEKGTATQSGFGNALRVVSRKDQNFRNKKSIITVPADYFTVIPYLFPSKNSTYSFASRYQSVSRHDEWIFKDLEPIKIPIPDASSPLGVIGKYLIFTVIKDWEWNRKTFKENSVLAISIQDIYSKLKNPTIIEVYVPQSDEFLSNKIFITKDYIVLNPLKNVRGSLKVLQFSPTKSEVKKIIDFPGANITTSEVDFNSNTLFFSKESFISPKSIYSYMIDSDQLRQIYTGERGFDETGLQVKQLFAKSDDGTTIPFFVIGKESAFKTGNVPTILKGYGGYGYSLLPSYDMTYGKLWLEKGGIFAVANVRGGGELGPQWYKDGSKHKKINSVKDFVAVAKKLTSLGITNPSKLGIYGGSLGGLVVGGAMALEPHLFKAVMAMVPDFDMIRAYEIGGGSWIGEFGDPKIEEDRKHMLKYAPYQSLKSDVMYPSFFAFSRRSDDRVNPAHARKFTARLQSYGQRKAYYYEAFDGGHGSGNTLEQAVFWKTLQMTFFAKELDL